MSASYSPTRTLRLIISFLLFPKVITSLKRPSNQQLLHHQRQHNLPSSLYIRGGSTKNDTPTSSSSPPSSDPLQSYLLEQHHLHTLRHTLLSEYLATRRKIPLPTLQSIQTPDSATPPQPVDWDCALSTEDSPKPCLYSFEAPPYAKVVGPVSDKRGKDDNDDDRGWITLSALNRLRRSDPAKVEPMWHDRYAVLREWFGVEGQYSLISHGGWGGFLISHVLLDRPLILRGVLLLGLFGFLALTAPLWEFLLNRFLVSGFLWRYYKSWGRFVHAAFPLKLLVGQMVWKFVAGRFDALEAWVKGIIVDIECGILEQTVPITVGEGVSDGAEEEGEDYDEPNEYDDNEYDTDDEIDESDDDY